MVIKRNEHLSYVFIGKSIFIDKDVWKTYHIVELEARPTNSPNSLPYEKMHSRTKAEKSLLKAMLLLAVVYSLFVIYGSLVPLEFQPVSLEAAWYDFKNIPYLDLSIRSRADWVANILLFIPLAFLWQGVLHWHKKTWLKLIIPPLLWLGLILFSCALEFSQIFFPQRTVSQNDIIAESIGAGTGILLWLTFGTTIRNWFLSWKEGQGKASIFNKLLVLYLAGLFFYNIMPLDLTLSPVEIYHQWKEGRVHLVPFSASYDTTARMIYELGTDALLWTLPALLWIMGSRKSAGTVWFGTLGMAVGLEFIQLFVFTRVTDSTDLITAASGAFFGCLLGRQLKIRLFRDVQRQPARLSIRLYAGTAGILAWIFILIILFWYPFEFTTEREFVLQRLEGMFKVPFSAYYFGTEYRALTEVLHKVLFFFPLGAILALTAVNWRTRAKMRLILDGLLLFFITGVALGIELGQVLIPGKNVDTTDFFLEIIGGWSGYFGTVTIHRLINGNPSPSSIQTMTKPDTDTKPSGSAKQYAE